MLRWYWELKCWLIRLEILIWWENVLCIRKNPQMVRNEKSILVPHWNPTLTPSPPQKKPSISNSTIQTIMTSYFYTTNYHASRFFLLVSHLHSYVFISYQKILNILNNSGLFSQMLMWCIFTICSGELPLQ